MLDAIIKIIPAIDKRFARHFRATLAPVFTQFPPHDVGNGGNPVGMALIHISTDRCSAY
jgi:hypothetical protein